MRRARLLRRSLWAIGARRTAAACAGLLVLTACSQAPHEPAVPEVVVVQPAAEPVREAGDRPGGVLRSRVTRVAGHLSDVRRERVARQARAVVADYLAGAFSGRGDPFGAFPAELRRAARSDGDLLAAAGGGVEVRRARAWFSVAAPAGRPVGLTARLDVRLVDGQRTGSLTGRLLMTRVTTGVVTGVENRPGATWAVFGYDLARSTDHGPQR